MSDLICIDDTFSTEAREVYEKYKIVTPYLGCIYSVRKIVKTRNGIGLLLNELVNPSIWIEGEGENAMYAEPNWGLFRFKNIDNTEITYDQLTLNLVA